MGGGGDGEGGLGGERRGAGGGHGGHGGHGAEVPGGGYAFAGWEGYAGGAFGVGGLLRDGCLRLLLTGKSWGVGGVGEDGLGGHHA